MSDKVIVRQNNRFEVGFWAGDPEQPESDDFIAVQALHEITPYGMLLFSLATCTAQVVLSYARNHDVPLNEVEFRLKYERDYKEDCENCEHINVYEERIEEEIRFFGDLDHKTRQKLFHIAHQCPIAKMFEQGIRIESQLK